MRAWKKGLEMMKSEILDIGRGFLEGIDTRNFSKRLSGTVHTGVEVCRMDSEMSELVE